MLLKAAAAAAPPFAPNKSLICRVTLQTSFKSQNRSLFFFLLLQTLGSKALIKPGQIHFCSTCSGWVFMPSKMNLNGQTILSARSTYPLCAHLKTFKWQQQNCHLSIDPFKTCLFLCPCHPGGGSGLSLGLSVQADQVCQSAGKMSTSHRHWLAQNFFSLLQLELLPCPFVTFYWLRSRGADKFGVDRLMVTLDLAWREIWPEKNLDRVSQVSAPFLWPTWTLSIQRMLDSVSWVIQSVRDLGLIHVFPQVQKIRKALFSFSFPALPAGSKQKPWFAHPFFSQFLHV